MAKSYVVMSSKGGDIFWELADGSYGAYNIAKSLAQRGYEATAYSCPSLTVSIPYKEGLEDRLAAIWETETVTDIADGRRITFIPGPDSPASEIIIDMKAGYAAAYGKAKDEAECAADVFELLMDEGYSIPTEIYDGLTDWIFTGHLKREKSLIKALRAAADFLDDKEYSEARECRKAAADLEDAI